MKPWATRAMRKREDEIQARLTHKVASAGYSAYSKACHHLFVETNDLNWAGTTVYQCFSSCRLRLSL